MATEPDWKSALRPYADQYAALITRIENDLEEMTDEQLAALEAQLDEPSESNCWWAIYDVAGLLRKYRNDEDYRRWVRAHEG